MTKARTNADNVAGDISGVTAGTGLTGGGTSGAITLTNDMATTINAAGDLIYGTGNDAYTRLALGTARQTLLTNAGATAPEWAASPQSLMTATGDILYASAANTPARLGLGTASQYLAVNSGATAPEWVTLNAGGMTLISETIASALSSLSLSSIPGTYKQLMLIWSGIYHSNSSTYFDLRFNNVSTASYAEIWHFGFDGTSNSTNRNNRSTVSISAFGEQTDTTTGSDLSLTNRGWLTIDNYASTSRKKSYEISSWNAITGGSRVYYHAGGIFDSTSAITSLDVVRTSGTGTFSNATNTTIRLYGVS